MIYLYFDVQQHIRCWEPSSCKVSLYAIRHGIVHRSRTVAIALSVNDRTIVHIVFCFYPRYTVLVPPRHDTGLHKGDSLQDSGINSEI